MTRTRTSAKTAGTRTERAAANYLNRHVDDRIDRRVKTGAKDRGDLAGIRTHGQRVVAEVKDCSRLDIAGWLREAELERGNDDAIAGVVIAKRRGRGDPADLLVLMTLADFAALLTGQRPDEIDGLEAAISSRGGSSLTAELVQRDVGEWLPVPDKETK